jgi:hypothetical protein
MESTDQKSDKASETQERKKNEILTILEGSSFYEAKLIMDNIDSELRINFTLVKR